MKQPLSHTAVSCLVFCIHWRYRWKKGHIKKTSSCAFGHRESWYPTVSSKQTLAVSCSLCSNGVRGATSACSCLCTFICTEKNVLSTVCAFSPSHHWEYLLHPIAPSHKSFNVSSKSGKFGHRKPHTVRYRSARHYRTYWSLISVKWDNYNNYNKHRNIWEPNAHGL